MNGQNKTDEQLLADYLAGNDGAFEQLVERYYRQIFRFLVRFTGRRHLAEELTQDVFVKVSRSAETFDLSRKLKPWIYSVAANRARDALRSMSRAGRQRVIQDSQIDETQSLIDILADEHTPPETQMIQQETADRVKAVVNKLPANLREVLVMAYYQHLAYKEIAEALDIPLGTVKSRLHKAVTNFGQLWRAEENERQ